jgi:hypothetical protein
MVPQGFAAPNAALNSTINRGNALSLKLAALGIIVTSMNINPVGPATSTVPMGGISIPSAEAQGVGPDDLVHLLFDYIGSEGIQPEVAVIEQLLAPGTVSAVVALFTGLFPVLTTAGAEGRALGALANLPAVVTALQAVLS